MRPAGSRTTASKLTRTRRVSQGSCVRVALVLLREVEYVRPGSIAEALEALGANDGARALAGGQTLINVMKARAASPDVLVDLNALEELRGVERDGDGLRIGAMVTYAGLMRDAN